MVKTILGGVTVSGGNYNIKDLWVSIFCYIMIMYTFRNDNDNYPGPDMDKAYKIIQFHRTLNVKSSKE